MASVLFLVALLCVAEPASILLTPTSAGGLQRAVAVSSPQDTIQISAGTYSGPDNCNVQISADLGLVGSSGPTVTIFDCLNLGRCLIINGTAQVSVTGLALTNGRVAESAASSRQQRTKRNLPVVRRKKKKMLALLVVRETRVYFSTSGELEAQIVTRVAGQKMGPVKHKTRAKLGESLHENAAPQSTRGLPVTSFGGCVLVTGGAAVTLTNVRISGCSAKQGSGLGAYGADSVVVQDSVFANNGIAISTSESLYGGGAYFGECGTVSVAGSVFASNSLETSGDRTLVGAGMAARLCGSVSVTRTSFTSNRIQSAGYNTMRGAGLYVFGTDGDVAISDARFIGNAIGTTGWVNLMTGGGLCVYTNYGEVRLTNIEASGNALVARGFDADGEYVANQLSGGGLMVGEGPLVEFAGSLVATNNSVVLTSQGTPGFGGGLFIQGIELSTFNCRLVNFSQNIFVQAGDRESLGAGAHFIQNNIIRMHVGTIIVESNRATAAYFLGALGFEISANVTIVATTVLISRNAIASGARGLTGGGGLLTRNCASVTISVSERMTVSDNIVTASLSGELTQTAPYVQDLVNTTVDDELNPSPPVQCAATSPIITSTSGRLSDGSVASSQYTDNLRCVWTVQVSDLVSQVFGRLHVSVGRFDLEASDGCSNDYLSLYDGITTRAPLLSRCCGRGVCVKGTHQTFPLYTSGAAITVVFHTDGAIGGSGYELAWALERSPGYDSGGLGLVPDLTEFGSASIGGGLLFSGGAIALDGPMSVSRNVATHPIHASGGGVAVINQGSLVINGSVIIDKNVAAGLIATGGAMAALEKGSIVVLPGLRMTGNSVRGTGRCYPSPVDGTVRCAASFGGGVAASIGGSVALAASVASNNSATCDGPACAACGGAVASARGGVAVSAASSVSCVNNSASTGGCAYAESGQLNVTDSVVESNAATGGGGIAVSGSAALSMRRSTISRNTASEGGGVWLSGEATGAIALTVFGSNAALSVAGAIAATEDARLHLHDSECVDNTAGSRAAAILSFNDNGLGLYVLRNVSISGEPGSAVIMLGRVTVSDSTVAVCNWPGTVIEKQYDAGRFFSLSCTACGPGTYAIGRGSTAGGGNQSCLACAPGAVCVGSNRSSNGLLAYAGFWGSVDAASASVEFHDCPPGFCCNNEAGCAYDSCSGRRQGPLCGQCGAGESFRFFSEKCFDNSGGECRDAAWAVPALVVAATGFTLALLKITSPPYESSNFLGVVMFFYQVVPIVKSTPWLERSQKQFFATVNSLFSMSLPSSDSSGSVLSVCLIPELTAAGRISVQLFFHATVALTFCASFLIHLALGAAGVASQPETTRYFLTSIRFFTIAYITVVLTPLQMIQCVDFDGRKVWFYDASVECYQEGWQIGAFASFVALLPMPLAVAYITAMWTEQREISPLKRLMRVFLGRGYAENRKWYVAVSLFRRLLLAVVFTLVSDRNWRSLATSSLLFLFVFLHLQLKPFAVEGAQNLETASLLILGFLSVSSSPQAAKIQYGYVSSVAHSEELEWLQFVLALVPGLGLAMVMGRRLRTMLQSRRGGERAVAPAEEQSGIELAEEEGGLERAQAWEKEATPFLRLVAYC